MLGARPSKKWTARIATRRYAANPHYRVVRCSPECGIWRDLAGQKNPLAATFPGRAAEVHSPIWSSAIPGMRYHAQEANGRRAANSDNSVERRGKRWGAPLARRNGLAQRRAPTRLANPVSRVHGGRSPPTTAVPRLATGRGTTVQAPLSQPNEAQPQPKYRSDTARRYWPAAGDVPLKRRDPPRWCISGQV